MKKIWKRLISAGLVIALVVTMVNIIPRNNNIEVTHAAEVSNGVRRGTVQLLSELPQYNNPANLALPRGTVDHPFVILEIVPYEEYAEIGYLISGCEPVRIEDMYGDSLAYSVSSISVGKFKDDKTSYFFSDEPESKENRYDEGYHGPTETSGNFAGYYELVSSGGTFNYSYVKNEIEEPEETEEPTTPETDNELDDQTDNENESVNGQSSEDQISSDDQTGNDEPTEDQPGDMYGYNSGTLVKTLDMSNTINGSGDDNDLQETEPVPSQSAEPETEDEQSDIDESEVVPDESKSEESESEEPGVSEPSVEEPVVSAPDAEEQEIVEDVILLDELMALTETQSEYTVTIERNTANEGNLIWHTVTKSEREALEAAGITFTDNIDEKLLTKIGDRIYTTRTATSSDKAVKVDHYYYYTHEDPFLKRSLNLSDEAAANYSIVVKTITPEQLNIALDWIDYADLIYLSPKKHVDATTDVWIKFNDYYHQPTRADKQYGDTDNKNYLSDPAHDLSWDAALRIYNKVTADTNFAAMIFDDNLFNAFPTDTYKRDVKITVYNWNLQPTKNIYGTQCDTFNTSGYNNNIYKLYVMLMCMDPNLFKQIYLSGSDPIVKNGVNRLQTGDAATYWCTETFMLAPDNIYPSPYSSLQNYWSTVGWDLYHYGTTDTTTTRKDWCDGHLFTFNGSLNFTQFFEGGELLTDKSKFTDFANALNGYLDDPKEASSAEAVRYILGDQPDSKYYGYNQTLKVLDLEPSVGLVLNNNTEDATSKWLPNWFLTKTYVNMLLPHFRGNIEIEHQTTAEFIGKIEDLNTTYDLVYMGLDCSGYNTKAWDIGNGRIAVLPDWNDNSLDQKIYIRTGDLAMSKEGNDGYGYQSANWLYDKSTRTLANTGQRMRFAGNDISKLKKADLEDFLNAYYPIVAEQQLFDLDTRIIETNTYVYQLISEQKAQNKPIYGTLNTASIENAARNALGNAITFVESPVRYDGTTVSDTSPEFKNTNCYLPRNAYGNAYLYFKINAAANGYRYRIYVDLNRDSRFSDDEIMNDTSGTKNVLAVGDNEYLQPLPSDWVGLLQWKAEVYLETNPSVRYEMTGCSAVQRNASTSSGKKKVTVLHIMPEWGSGYQGALNLQTNGTFIKYYKDLEDYDVTITSISYDEYEKYFYYLDNRGQRKSWNFTYDYSKEMDENNPYNLDKLHNDNYADLMNYNMIIVGFGDCYGSKNMTNQYGQMDFLRYFADQGRSILFTHDLTTFYNAVTTNLSFTANTQLRDIMGMNRYASVNYYLDTTIRNRLIADQAANADKYDTNYTPETHGFTYFAIKRMGQVDGQVYRMPYRNMVNNLQGNPIGEQGTGFNFDNDPTTQVSKVNEGQITVYPYKIDDNFKIAETHSQYYQLSPEDDNLTVWYCLAGDGDIAHTYGTGTSLTYAVSPNDTMENYYIYSKGNIFYSGVGHSTVTGDMEAKLFVNTMIAAYNAAYEPPKVEVTNPEAISRGSFEYDIELMQSYDFDEHGNLVATASNYYDVNENGELVYNVIFTPQDYNLASGTTLECQIQWENGDYVTEVVRLSDGAILHADSNNVFHNFTRGQEYSLEYPMKYLSDYHWEKTIDGELKSGEYIRTISFSIKNNRVDAKNITVLNINVLPLFPLD